MAPFMPELTPAALQTVTFLLVALAVGTTLLAVWPRGRAQSRFESRVNVIRGLESPGQRRGAASDEERRRRLVEDTLRELDARQKAKARRGARPTLTGRLRQAGLGWNKSTYFMVCGIAGAVTYAVVLGVSGLGFLPAAGFGAAAALLLPHLYVARRRASRLRTFGAEFPNALDVIVRGVKAGLPLADCLKIIGAEGQEPVRSEFRGIVHDQTFGIPLDEAVERLADRVPLAESNFFAIVIAIQSRTGGNLSEALGNLSKVLRDRKQMKAKIKALSAEAKASAGIIGSMPIIVALLLYFTSPDYISLLFTTSAGNITLAASGLWMLIGVLVMRKMINFDF